MEMTALSLISFLIPQCCDREFWEIKAQPGGTRSDLQNGLLGGLSRAQVTAVLSHTFLSTV